MRPDLRPSGQLTACFRRFWSLCLDALKVHHLHHIKVERYLANGAVGRSPPSQNKCDFDYQCLRKSGASTKRSYLAAEASTT